MPSIRKKSFAAEQLARQQQKKVSPVVWVLVGVVVVLLVVGGYVMYQRSAAEKQVETETEQIKSIAVLPFVDMSPEKDQAYLGDGIADAIINAINNVGELRVIDRTSSFQFRGKENAIDEIAEKLTVDAVLEGSVHKQEKRLRIMAQLIKVSDHSHFFLKNYDIDFSDIFTVQDSISLLVLKELKFTLMGKEKAAIVRRYTNDPDAYELYLQGLYYADLGSNSQGKAREYFQQAIDKDPDFALAYAGLARVSRREEQKALLNKALELLLSAINSLHIDYRSDIFMT